LIRTVPDDADWGMVQYSGSNGLALAVMALSWWVDMKQPSVELSAALDDMRWVLTQLVRTLGGPNSETGTSCSKRSRESGGEERRSKRSKK
jgi:hypothetical protein